MHCNVCQFELIQVDAYVCTPGVFSALLLFIQYVLILLLLFLFTTVSVKHLTTETNHSFHFVETAEKNFYTIFEREIINLHIS